MFQTPVVIVTNEKSILFF